MSNFVRKKSGVYFSNNDLKKMIAPLFFEQLLVMLVGIADTLIVSYAGESSVSGVSLVNQFNMIFIYIFTALASGGAVVISQYIGNNDKENSEKSAGQLLMISTIISIIMSILVIVGNKTLIELMFGKTEVSVMNACITYLKISAYSYPALAVYNSGAAIYRSLGKTNVTMYISIISNIINITGNIIGVFVLKVGVVGVAYPSLISRIFSATAITYLCFKKSNSISYRKRWIFIWKNDMLKRILKIAVPNGIEQGLFQLIKVALSSIVALFGTYQIAANGIAQSIWSLAALMGVAMNPAFITVIGRCMGAGDTDKAEYYFKKLMKITIMMSVIWNIFIFALTPAMLTAYDISNETKNLVIWLVVIHNTFNALAFPFSGALSSGLRAAGDVKFTMYISIISTIGIRFLLSVLFGIKFNMGVIGIALAMCYDWILRAVIFEIRLRKGIWKQFKVI